MQFETKITLVDLKVILNNMMLIKLRVAVKRNGSDCWKIALWLISMKGQSVSQWFIEITVHQLCSRFL
jgi:hypothetical protein